MTSPCARRCRPTLRAARAAFHRLAPLLGVPLLLALLLAVAPAAAQGVRWGQPEELPAAELPLKLSVAGWGDTGFTRGWRRTGTAESGATATQHEGYFTHVGYFGRILITEASDPKLLRSQAPADTLRNWNIFNGKQTTPGETGETRHGRMEIRFALVALDERNMKSCALFTGLHERWQLNGFLCAREERPLRELVPVFLRGLGYGELFRPQQATLPVVHPLANPQLVDRLEKSTVLVLATRQRGAGIGTGFFIAPDKLLTNRHVVEGAERIVVTSRTLGKPVPAKLLAITRRGEVGSADYALLEVQGLSREPVVLSTRLDKLQEVIAAGYPGITISNDASFQALLRGDRSAAPDLVITRGEVNAQQINQAKVPTIAHTALISEGNSGGPLVDRCGRVVGINTYIAAKTTVTGFAIASADLIEFLTKNGARPQTSTQPCSSAEEARR